MLQQFTVNLPDGNTVVKYAKYEREELDQMGTDQLIQVLSELKQFANYCDTNFFTPIQKLEDECNKLNNYKAPKPAVKIFGALTICCFLLYVIFYLSGGLLALLGILMLFLALNSAGVFVFTLIAYLKNKSTYKKRYPQANADLQQLYIKRDAEIFGTYLDNLVNGKAVLPNYFLNESALDFMISALQNHRATSLAEAVNLYESTKLMQTQNDLLSAQLAAQQSAARSAAQAAAAAQSAASSASTTATNTIYSRKS